MKKTIVIVGGSAGALIATEIFVLSYAKVFYLETYNHEISGKNIIAKKISEGIDFLKQKNVDYFIATGDNQQRKQNFDLIFKKTKKVPVNCIHSTAYISPSSTMGYGNLVCPSSVIHQGACVGNGTIINTGAIIEHTCVIGDFAQISPNTTLCGYVDVGQFAFVGAGSVVIPKIKIGAASIVAAGSSVICDIKKNALYAGVPAKYKKAI